MMDDFIPTRVSKLKSEAAKEFVSVSYEGPKRASNRIAAKELDSPRNPKSSAKRISQSEEDEEKKRRELDMKRVRYEVMKFGMSGLRGEQAEEANVALAISLGAKPPKRKAVNYKVLQSQRKIDKDEQQRSSKHESGLERSLIKHKTKKTRKKNSDGILGVYGKVKETSIGKSKR